MNVPKSGKKNESRRSATVAIGARMKRLTNDKFFRVLMENSFDGITLISANGKSTYESPAVGRILGYTPEERLGQSVFDFVHPEDMSLARQLFDQLLQESGSKQTAQLRLRHKGGRWKWLEVTGTNLLGEPGVESIIVHYRDISERKEDDLIWRILSSVVEQTADPVIITDVNGKIEYINSAFTNVTGFTANEVMGLNPSLWKSGTHPPQYYKHMWDTILSGKTWFNTFVNRKKDGELYFAESTISPIYSPEGRIVNFVSVQKDVTGRMKAEEKLHESQEQLRQSENKLRTLFASMTDVIIIFDSAGRYLETAPTNPSNLYRPLADLLGKTVKEVFSSEQADLFLQKIRQTLETKQATHFEYSLPIAGAEVWFWCTISPLSLDSVIWIAHDITDRKRAEEVIQQRAREQETLYQTSLEIDAQNELDVLLNVIVERAASLLGVESAGLYLLEPDGQTLHLKSGYGMPQRYIGTRIKLGEGLSGKVAQTGEALTVEDYRKWQGRASAYNDSDFRRVLGVPLKVKNQVIGVINVSDLSRSGSFSGDEIRLVSLFADQAATAVNRERLLEDARRHLRHTQALHKIDQAIAGSIDLSVVLDIVLHQTIAELGVDAAVVLLYDPIEQVLKYIQGAGLRTNALEYTRLRLGDGYAGQAALARQTIFISDLQTRTTDFLRSPMFHQEDFFCYFGVPLIAKGEIKGVLEIFHRAPLNPEKEWLDFMETLAGQMAIAFDNASLYRNLQHSNVELHMAYDATIEGWSKALDLRDKETEGHTQRVTKLTLQLARAMNIGGAELIHIQRGALLHDIGKMGVPDSILLKPDKLTDDEWKVMRKHPIFAYELLSPIEYLRPALNIPYCHHEKWDGTGYPRGLKGEQIPLEARIFAVVDVYDALTSDRPYRPAWTKEQALEHIRQGAGSHFDPQVAEKFIPLIATDQ